MSASKKYIEFGTRMTALWGFTVIAMMVGVIGCQVNQDSQVTGLGRGLLIDHMPEARSTETLVGVKRQIVRGMLSESSLARHGVSTSNPRSALSRILVKTILAVKGLPRYQIKEVLADVLDPKQNLCGRASCGRIFGVKVHELDTYLDGLEVALKKSLAFRDAEHAHEYARLLGSLKKSDQIAWNRPTVDGLSYLPNGEIDRTEGVGAFVDLPLAKGNRNLDVGGGAHEANTKYLATRGVINYVYDPYARSDSHNQDILRKVAGSPVDSVTSMSILNVIDNQQARRLHINLCKRSLKAGGRAYFKVWAGNGSGKGEYILGGYQSNREAKSYLQDVQEIFGRQQVSYDEGLKALVAVKE